MTRYRLVGADDIELGKDGSQWKHGYIPENPAAVALKNHRKPGDLGRVGKKDKRPEGWSVEGSRAVREAAARVKQHASLKLHDRVQLGSGRYKGAGDIANKFTVVRRVK